MLFRLALGTFARCSILKPRRKRLLSLGKRASLFGGVLSLVGSFLSGCQCESSAPGSNSTKEASSPPLVARCVRSPRQLTLRPAKSEVESNGDWMVGHADFAAVDAPFSVEVGQGVGFEGGFWITALRAHSAGHEALLAHLDGSGLPVGPVRSLGVVSGQIRPPHLVVSGDLDGKSELIVTLQQPKSGGFELQIARLSGVAEEPLKWRQGPFQAADESNNYDVAARSNSMLVAWDEWSKLSRRGVALVSYLGQTEGQAPSELPEPRPLSRIDSDAEAPRIVVRPGGYWAAWIVNAARPLSSAVYAPSSTAPENPSAKVRASLAFGKRWIELLALDERGHKVGKTLRITSLEQRVVAFDLRTAQDGNAWVVWRAGAPSPAAGGGTLSVVAATLGGQLQSYPVPFEGLGAGEPSWISAEGADETWLTFADDRDRIQVLPLSGFPLVEEPWPLDSELLGATVLAARSKTFLFALPRGRQVELTTGQCGRAAASRPKVE